MVPELAKTFAGQFPELDSQQDFIARVIQEEEISFLKTLETGIKKFDQYEGKLWMENLHSNSSTLSGSQLI